MSNGEISYGRVGTKSRLSANPQIWIALCVHLMLSYIKFANRLAWSLNEILRVLQLNLFEGRPLAGLLDPPPTPPDETEWQLQLNFC